jgi:hypothetical protein
MRRGGLLLALALAAAAVVSGCGGGDGTSDEDQVRDTVDQFTLAVGNSDEGLCSSLVASGGNIADQVRAAESIQDAGTVKQITGIDIGGCGFGKAANDIAGLTISKVDVAGDTATVAFENSTATFRLVKDGDEWKIETIKAPDGAVAGKVAKCYYEAGAPGPTNDVQVSGGATCAEAKWLYFHPLRPSDTVRGWTCAQQLLGPHGPTLAFCAHGRNKRASFLYH